MNKNIINKTEKIFIENIGYIRTGEHNAQRQTKRQRISEMTEFLGMQSGIITEYDDKLTRQLVEKITVFEGKFQIDFKSGVDIEVEI